MFLLKEGKYAPSKPSFSENLMLLESKNFKPFFLQ